MSAAYYNLSQRSAKNQKNFSRETHFMTQKMIKSLVFLASTIKAFKKIILNFKPLNNLKSMKPKVIILSLKLTK